MEEVGIRELKQHTSDIIRRVREEKETISITYRGHVVAQITPVEDLEAQKVEALEVWHKMNELAQEIGARLPKDASAEDAIREQRREL